MKVITKGFFCPSDYCRLRRMVEEEPKEKEVITTTGIVVEEILVPMTKTVRRPRRGERHRR